MRADLVVLEGDPASDVRNFARVRYSIQPLRLFAFVSPWGKGELSPRLYARRERAVMLNARRISATAKPLEGRLDGGTRQSHGFRGQKRIHDRTRASDITRPSSSNSRACRCICAWSGEDF